jgi:NAD(P)H-hydrate repair Nnr-like enzyme with NAD(P)H-hydrate epimerase domain
MVWSISRRVGPGNNGGFGCMAALLVDGGWKMIIVFGESAVQVLSSAVGLMVILSRLRYRL